MAQSTYLCNLSAPAARFVSALTVGIACSLSLSANADTIPGEIILVAGECPGGYLPADGSQVDLTAYPELASVVQTSYGGTGGSMGTIGLPNVESASVLQDTYDYVYSKDEITALASPATSYLVKVSDDRNLRNVIEVTVPKKAKGDLDNPQGFIPFIASFEDRTNTTVENYVIRTKSGFALANGKPVAKGTEASFWFGAYCTGNNGTCANTNKAITSVDLSTLEAGEADDFGRPVRETKLSGYLGAADDMNDVEDPSLEQDFAPFEPQYCVAVGGDTAPLVEVGLSFVQGENFSGELEFNRVDVSGYSYDELPQGCFEDGNLCLDALQAANPGIGRPNIAFRIVGENVCAAAEVVEVTTSIDCKDAGNVGDNTVVERYVYADLSGFCDAVGGVVHSDGNFCESKSRKDKLNNGLCNALGGERGDSRNSDAISPICLPPADLGSVNSDISRDAFSFVKCDDPAGCFVEEQPTAQCIATEYVDLPYPGELRMSGVQIAFGFEPDKDNVDWGNDFQRQRERLIKGLPIESDFSYITQRDEEGRQGFVAADLVDERTLILENRNISDMQDYQYRVQAQCGDGDEAYNVYYDPLIRTGGGGGSSNY